MGQIVIRNQAPRYCNLVAIQTGGSKADIVLANGEIWLVDTTNAVKENGTGVYDAYIKGDGSTVAKNLTVEYLSAKVDLSAYSTTAQMNAAIQSAVSGKQDALTFDSAPTASSSNPVTSAGIKMALDTKADLSDVNTALAQQQAAINTLNGNTVVVVTDHTAVSSPAANTIYREQGTASYTDWMYDSGQWKPIAEYSFPGIDSTPVHKSNNLVTSGGVMKVIDDISKIVVSNVSGASMTSLGWTYKKSTLYSTGEGDVIVKKTSVYYTIIYVTSPVFSKDDIIHFHREASVSRKVTFGFSTINPSTLSTIEGVQLYGLQTHTATIHDYDVVCPFDNAYLFYCYYDQDWVSNTSAFEYKKIEYVTSAVIKKEQSLTSEEQRQIRKNIGFGDGNIDYAPKISSENVITSSAVAEALNKIYKDTRIRQLCPVACRQQLIVSNGVIAHSGTVRRRVDFIKCKKNELYEIEIKYKETVKDGNVRIYYCSTLPVENTSVELIRQAKIPETVESVVVEQIEVSEDGYLCFVFNGDNFLTALYRYDLLPTDMYQYFGRENIIGWKQNKHINADPADEENFGVEAGASLYWWVSPFVDVSSFSYIRIKGKYVSSYTYANSPFGSVFYDENEKPLETAIFIAQGINSTADVIVKVPENAKYIRITAYKNGDLDERIIDSWGKKKVNEISATGGASDNLSIMAQPGNSFVLTKDMFDYGSLQGDGNGAPIYYSHIGYSRFIKVKGGSTIFFHRDAQTINGNDADLQLRVQARVNDNYTDGKSWTLVHMGYSFVERIKIPSNYNYISIGIKYGGVNGDIMRYYDNQLSMTSDYPLEITHDYLKEIDLSSIDTTDIIALNEPKECRGILENMNFSGKPAPLVLLHFSDIHGDAANIRRIARFYNYYSEYINDVICTGDSVYNSILDPFDLWENDDTKLFLNTLGNHDASTIENSQYVKITALESYNIFFANYIGEWGVSQPENASEGKCYYYKNYETKKIRLVVLDCMNYDDSQQKWFDDVLSDTLMNHEDYSVIVGVHYSMTAPNQSTLIRCNFTSYAKINGSSSTGMTQEIINSIDNFIDNGGKFICYLTGHSHTSMIGYSNSTHKQMFICVGGAVHNQSTWEDGSRTYGTKMQDHFNVVCFDTNRQQVKIVKIGKTWNRYLQHAFSIVIQYDYSGTNPPAVLWEN